MSYETDEKGIQDDLKKISEERNTEEVTIEEN
jgi:hypothetical protein